MILGILILLERFSHLGEKRGFKDFGAKALGFGAAVGYIDVLITPSVELIGTRAEAAFLVL